METSNSFGYWLRRRRKALDLTQEALAQLVGCTADAIKKIEADSRRPSLQLAERLADCLAVPPSSGGTFCARPAPSCGLTGWSFPLTRPRPPSGQARR